MKALFINDNFKYYEILVRILERYNYQVEKVIDEEVIFNAIKSGHCQLLVIPCNKSQRDGYEIAQKVSQRWPKEGRPKMVALLTSTHFEDIRKCYDSGFDTIINQPIGLKDLIKKVQLVANSFSIKKKKNKRKLIGDLSPLHLIDKVSLNNHFEGDDEILFNSIDRFLNKYDILLRDIQNDINRVDTRALTLHAHTLKTAVGLFFAKSVKDAAYCLELMGKNGNMENAKSVFTDLESQIKILVIELNMLKSEEKKAA